MALGGEARKILVEFLGDSRELVAASRSAEGAVSTFGTKAQTAGKIAGKALAGGLLLAGAGLYEAGKAASEDQASQALLEQQLKNNTKATDEDIDKVNEWIEAQAVAKGVAVDDLRPALAKLATATGDVGKSQKLLALAMDVSAGSGKSLDTVTSALIKAQNGSLGGLGRLGVATKDAAGHTKTLEQVTADLAQRYKGDAAKAAETNAGKQKVLGVEMHELSVKIGTAVLPAFQKLLEIGLKVVDFISRHTKAVALTVAALGALLTVTWAVSAAMGIYAVVTGEATAATLLQKTAVGLAYIATKAWTLGLKAAAAAQWLFNAAMDANPIGLIVLAIAALAVGLVLAYKKSETFRNIVNAAFHGVAAVVKFVVDFVKDHWRLMISLMLGPFGIAIALITKHWAAIKYAAQVVIDWVRDHWPAIKDMIVGPFQTAKTLIGNVWADVKAGFGVVRDKLSNGVDSIRSAFATGFNAVKSVIQGVIDKVQYLYDKISSLISKLTHIPHPHIPGLGRTSAGDNTVGTMVGGTKEQIAEGRSMLEKASGAVKKHLADLQQQLQTAKDAFKAVRDSVAGAFASDLFGVSATEAIKDSEGNITAAAQSAGQNFISTLMAKKDQLSKVSDAFKTLIGWGWKPQALAAMFQSGNAGLILDLAANKDMAQQGANLYGDVTSMSDALGADVATSVDGGQIGSLQGQIDSLSSKGKGGKGSDRVSVTVNMGLVTDPVAAAREVVKAMRQLERSTGRPLLVSPA